LWLLGKLFEGKARFYSLLCVAAYAHFPLFLRGLAANAIRVMDPGIELHTGLRALFPNLMLGSPTSQLLVSTFLSHIDIFTLWSLSLTILGIWLVSKFRLWKATAVVFLWWMVWYGLVVGIELIINIRVVRLTRGHTMNKEKGIGFVLSVLTAYMLIGLALAMSRYSCSVKQQSTSRDTWLNYPQHELVEIGFPIREVPDDQNAAIEYDRTFDLYAGAPGHEDVYNYVVDNVWINEAEALIPWLEQNAAAITAFREGAKNEDCKFRLLRNPEYPFWPRSSLSFIRVRETTTLIVFEGKYLEHQNKHREALNLYLAIAKMGHHISTASPSLVEGALGAVIKNMSAGAIESCILRNRLDTPTVTYVHERLDVLGRVVQNYHAVMSVDKAVEMAVLDHDFECRREVLVSSVSEWREGARVLLMDLGPSLGFRPLSRSDTMAVFRRVWDAVDKWNELPDHMAYAQGDKLLEKVDEEDRFWSLASYVIPSFRRIRLQFSTAKTTKAIITTVIALEVYRNKSSNYPDNLDELKGIPNDPFTNQPLKYTRTENGYIVYSAGENLVDDGGKGDDIVGRHPLPEPKPFMPG